MKYAFDIGEAVTSTTSFFDGERGVVVDRWEGSTQPCYRVKFDGQGPLMFVEFELVPYEEVPID